MDTTSALDWAQIRSSIIDHVGRDPEILRFLQWLGNAVLLGQRNTTSLYRSLVHAETVGDGDVAAFMDCIKADPLIAYRGRGKRSV